MAEPVVEDMGLAGCKVRLARKGFLCAVDCHRLLSRIEELERLKMEGHYSARLVKRAEIKNAALDRAAEAARRRIEEVDEAVDFGQLADEVEADILKLKESPDACVLGLNESD